jgi:Uncharacterized protein conserved in bacteria
MTIPGPDHPITVTPAQQHVTVRVGDKVVADTKSALALQEGDYPVVYYVPLADVDESLLVRTDTATHCPYKGDASYYSIRTGDGEITDAIWTYEQPYPAVAQIAGHVAFYPDRVQLALTE